MLQRRKIEEEDKTEMNTMREEEMEEAIRG